MNEGDNAKKENQQFAERLTITQGKHIYFVSANKDEIAMKSTAEKENEEINERERTKNEKLQHNCFVCTNEKGNDHLTNLRECRITAVRKKKNEKVYKEQVNKTTEKKTTK